MSAQEPPSAVEPPAVVVSPVRTLSAAEAGRRHLDAIELLQVAIPGLVALAVIICYTALVWHGVPGDGVLGNAVPLIVATYFVGQVATHTRRRGR